MALSKIIAEGVDLTDTFAFTGTVTGAGDVLDATTTVPSEGGAATTNLVQGLAKTWVNFDGSGPTVIRDSLGISAILDLGNGYTRLTFTSSFSNDDYAATGSAKRQSSDQSSIVMPTSFATATVEVDSWLENAGNGSRSYDLGTVCLNIHGDLA
jgi:hypothetical protein